MSSIVKEVSFDNIDNFIKAISYGGKLYDVFTKGKFVYRGHASDKYELIPSALRLQSQQLFNEAALKGGNAIDIEYIQIENEYLILRRFYKACDRRGIQIPNIDRIRQTFNDTVDLKTMSISEKWLPYDLWEIAALAQHYGLPTRLLDWTHDINVALFFSIEDQLEKKPLPKKTDNIVIWALELFPLSDIPNSDFPLKIVQPIYFGNPNLAAQQGLFTLWQTEKRIKYHPNGGMTVDVDQKINRKPLDMLLQEYSEAHNTYIDPSLYKLNLPLDEAKTIYKFLMNSGYDASKVYPGYNGVVKSILHCHFAYDDLLEGNGNATVAPD